MGACLILKPFQNVMTGHFSSDIGVISHPNFFLEVLNFSFCSIDKTRWKWCSHISIFFNWQVFLKDIFYSSLKISYTFIFSPFCVFESWSNWFLLKMFQVRCLGDFARFFKPLFDSRADCVKRDPIGPLLGKSNQLLPSEFSIWHSSQYVYKFI